MKYLEGPFFGCAFKQWTEDEIRQLAEAVACAVMAGLDEMYGAQPQEGEG